MKKSIVILLSFFTSVVSGQPTASPGIFSDTAKVVVIYPVHLPSFVPSQEDLHKAEQIAIKAIEDINDKEAKETDSLKKIRGNRRLKPFKIDFSYYYIQLLPRINSNNEKEIVVNCFCHIISNIDWKKKFQSRALIMDGGQCFFDFTINITRSSWSDYGVNGEA